MSDAAVQARPFLKWAGGKRQLLPELLARVPAKYHTYHEPFLGGGAMFFALAPRIAVLSDANLELVRSYVAVRDKLPGLVKMLRELKRGHEEWGLAHYREVRRRSPEPLVGGAARLIYLNKTCFNGLYRVNKRGEFNVPMGKWKKLPEICDLPNLAACSRVLSGEVDLGHRDFRQSLLLPLAEDFVYLDPPYAPLSGTSNFTRYTTGGFGAADQVELAGMVADLKKCGVKILLSNAGTQEIRDLYPEPLFRVEEVRARRKINCQKGGRGDVVEYLIS